MEVAEKTIATIAIVIVLGWLLLSDKACEMFCNNSWWGPVTLMLGLGVAIRRVWSYR